MNNMENKGLTTIYGIITVTNNYGVQGVAIDGNTGEVVASHFCSSENFAKSDLGFSGPLFQHVAFSSDEHSTVGFNERMKNKYSELYPNGYELVWVGHYTNNDVVVELLKNSDIIK